MKLKVIAQYENGKPSSLTLTKEKKVIEYGKVFDVSEERGKEILKATFQGKPVVAIVAKEAVIEEEAIIDGEQLKDNEVVEVIVEEVKIAKKKNNK